MEVITKGTMRLDGASIVISLMFATSATAFVVVADNGKQYRIQIKLAKLRHTKFYLTGYGKLWRTLIEADHILLTNMVKMDNTWVADVFIKDKPLLSTLSIYVDPCEQCMLDNFHFTQH